MVHKTHPFGKIEVLHGLNNNDPSNLVHHYDFKNKEVIVSIIKLLFLDTFFSCNFRSPLIMNLVVMGFITTGHMDIVYLYLQVLFIHIHLICSCFKW